MFDKIDKPDVNFSLKVSDGKGKGFIILTPGSGWRRPCTWTRPVGRTWSRSVGCQPASCIPECSAKFC